MIHAQTYGCRSLGCTEDIYAFHLHFDNDDSGELVVYRICIKEGREKERQITERERELL